MELRNALPTNRNTHIRIFCGPQTIFQGERADISDNEWNVKVGPYMDCKVLSANTINGRMIFAI